MEISVSESPSPDLEAARLRTLQQFNVPEAPPTDAFDRITRLAARLFDVWVAMVSFVDQDNQWCVATQGASLGRNSREVSFCTHAIRQNEVMVVPDATEDERFADNPFVTGEPNIRFYAGAPLIAPNGHRLGTLCLIDKEPRTFSEDDRATLEELAGVVMDELTLRRYASGLDASRRAFQETSERQRRILESITDAFVAIDEDWNFTYVNAQAEEFLERDRSELLGANLWEEFPEAMGSTFERKYQRAMDEGETVEFFEYYPPLNRWFEVKAFPFEGGVSVYFDDVTDRVEARENLRRERALIDAVMDTSVAAIVVINASGKISFANERAGEILGTEVEDMVGAEYMETGTLSTLEGRVLPPDEWPFQEIWSSGEPVSGERYVFERPDGAVRYLSVNGAPLYDTDNDVRQVVFSIEDITEQVEHERALREAKEEAERANELKGAFLANITHDLRTPLSSIMGSAELLAREASDAHRETIERIERSSRRLLETINSVLDLSKLETGSVEPEYKSLDLADELLGTVEIFKPQANEKNIELEAELNEDPMPADLDPTMLHRITDNLLSNAIKFTEPGGSVALRAYGQEGDVRIEVEDTGVGIDKEFLPDLFKSFSRSEEATGQEGSGLGLAITKRLTELMEGTIEVESEKGEGTTFTVRLPR